MPDSGGGLNRSDALGTASTLRLSAKVTVALAVMLFPLNTHLAFYSAWWGLLFAWLLGLWCAALVVSWPAKESDHAA